MAPRPDAAIRAEESARRHAEAVQRDHPKLKEWDWKVVTLLGGY